jgi:hypothetical protein
VGLTMQRPRILDELGDELVRAAREAEVAQRRGGAARRVPRAVLIGVAVLLLLAAVAAAATLIIGRGDPIPPAPAGSVPPELQPVPGTARLNGLDVPDPDGGPAWDVRTSRSRTGAICTTIGQVLDGELGLVGLDRRFRALPAGAADTCSTPQRTGATLAGARTFRGGGRLSDLTVVNGVAAPSVRRVVATGAGRTVTMRIGPGRAFVAVFRGTPEQVRPRLRLAEAGGGSTTLFLADAGEFLASDPSGGAPWALQTRKGAPGLRCIAAQREEGPDSPQPLPPGAFNPATASVPGRCGRRDVAFADLRRFVPRNQRIGRSFWWGLNPARTVVWGAVPDGRSAVVLRGDGAPRRLAVDPRSHGFLVALDGHVDPRRLVVMVDGRPAAGAVGTKGRRLAPARVPAWRSVDSVARRVAIPEPYAVRRDTVAIRRRAQDPSGGPAWALRTWSARIVSKIKEVDPFGRDMVCFAFGIDAGGGRLTEPLPGGRTRTVGTSARDGLCNSPRWLATHAGGPIVRTYVDDPTATDPRPQRVVVAGMLGSEVRSAQLLGAGAPRSLELGPLGTFLVVLGPDQAGRDLTVRQTRTDGTVRKVKADGFAGACAIRPIQSVRVADPAGGAPWVAGVSRVGRRSCRYVGRVVADQLAWVFDDMAWIAYGPGSSYGGTGAQFLSPRHPMLIDVAHPDRIPGRAVPTTTTPAEIARRTLPGHTTISGYASIDVTSITLHTPRDVRTLRPVGGVFLAVYDGAFYGGSIVATAHLRDGRTVTERIPASRG